VKKSELSKEVRNLYMSSEFNEFPQWAEETFYEMIPFLPVEKLKELKKDLASRQGYFED
jgi:hypothetical protein